MAYSDFTLAGVRQAFGLSLNEQTDLFAAVPETPASPLLQAILQENIPLALSIHTEKARSELIIVPILVEVRRVLNRRISLFSGIEFNVAPEQGLTGVCDFILSGSPEQLVLDTPLLVLVEAKNDNIKAGLGQCIAEMVAARIFNERAGTGPTTVYGTVTTGSIWKFLRLEGSTVFVDVPEYYLDRVEKVLGVLVHIMERATRSAA